MSARECHAIVAPWSLWTGTEDRLEGGDIYKVTFGACWAKVRREKHDITWKVTEGSDCPTAAGPAKVVAGKALVVDGKVDLYAEGSTTDGTTNVTWECHSLRKEP